jgi:hypothetical protein
VEIKAILREQDIDVDSLQDDLKFICQPLDPGSGFVEPGTQCDQDL